MLDPNLDDLYRDPVAYVTSVLHYGKRPVTLNAERRMHHFERAKIVKEWRNAFAWLAKLNHVPRHDRVVIIAQPHLKGGRMQDCDACHPSVKAAIDGLVDAGVLIDDSPPHVLEIRYMAPLPSSDDGLTITVISRNTTEKEPTT
jgi:hypothetical protein